MPDVRRVCPVCGATIVTARASTAESGIMHHLLDHTVEEMAETMAQIARRREYERQERIDDGADT